MAGIAVNFALALLKAVIGLGTHSIAIVLDAVNNLTDAGSSVITILGTKLAAKKPDKEHPFGHGRIEYLSAMLLGSIIMAAGISSLLESARKIREPSEPAYTALALGIIAVCVLVKIFLGRHFMKMGERTGSETLSGSGKDALTDALISAATLAAALIYLAAGVRAEAWLGLLISLVIIRTGAHMVLNTFSELVGRRVDTAIARQVEETVMSFPEVRGVYDLMFHDYGPGRIAGSVHIEVDDMMRAFEISALVRSIEEKVYEEHGVQLTAVGIYSMNSDERALQLRKEVTAIAMGYDHVLQVHGFYLMGDEVRFDVIVDFDTKDPERVCEEIAEKVREAHPELKVRAFADADYSFSE